MLSQRAARLKKISKIGFENHVQKSFCVCLNQSNSMLQINKKNSQVNIKIWKWEWKWISNINNICLDFFFKTEKEQVLFVTVWPIRNLSSHFWTVEKKYNKYYVTINVKNSNFGIWAGLQTLKFKVSRRNLAKLVSSEN